MNDREEETISLRRLFRRFRFKILLTWILVLLDAILILLFPLFMGAAIDDYLEGSSSGVVFLALLGLLSLVVGAGRRFYDTRVYSGIYATIAPELVDKEKKRDSSISVISARAGLATEFVEFLENIFPQILNSVINLVGALFIILYLNLKIFIACLVSTVLIALIYALSSKKIYRLNNSYNEELERRVEVLTGGEAGSIRDHFKKVMRWNIRLSDLETANFSVSWLLMIGVLIYAIVTMIESGASTHGKVFSSLMYVFNYIESAIAMPLFYQQFVRLEEITDRLEGGLKESPSDPRS